MSLIYAIIIITVVLSYKAFKDTNIRQKWIFSAYLIARDKSYYRFITSGFIHGDGVHLFVNMLTFYFFAPTVLGQFNRISAMGWLYFLILYLLAIVVSEIPSYIKHKDNIRYASLGASGGVSALLFSTILYHPDATISLYFIFDVPAILFGVLFLIYSHFASRQNDNVNHSAHTWGALTGLIFTILLDPSSIQIFLKRILNMV